ncbi:CDP-diacylglycerol--glycerol-3-phosphate 3-phosphatidyltransferase 2-like [Chenopodium quinoa]|uniref:CDP-diacylglycerol--glycerol-3-phosphate 3-phosphatidyltransferase 2-like n=1 Tax=Chenopodium quinoa TaxID=63459 RepID=UPI000B790F8F|nr:CDP-diacylglycerol--glycerol-3-phosphate 3-phosphatidyltransferase 2-like [Chenopodium quinoa]
MPPLQLLLRRTIATAGVANPPLMLSPTASMAKQSIPSTIVYSSKRSTLAKKRGACYGVACAHVKGLTTTTTKIKQMITYNIPNNINRKRVFMLSSSSSSSSPISEERESKSSEEEEKGGDRFTRVSDFGVGSFGSKMGFKDKRNDDDLNRNGVVLSTEKDQEEKGDACSSTKLLTLPTVLTLARVAAIPVFIGTFFVNSWWGAAATTSLFVAAAITDWLDGYLARKMRLGTAFGAFLDPVADKLMVAATLVLLCSKPPEISLFGDIPWLFPVPAIAIIGREITMSAVREWAASQDAKLLQAVAVNNLGKWKTATQMTALTFILATRDSSFAASQGALATSGVALLYISAGLAVWSLVVYMKKIWKVLMR